MRLLIDSGNTRVKYVVSNQGQWLETGVVEELSTLEEKLRAKYPALQQLIYSDVRGEHTAEKWQAYFPNFNVHALKSLPFPFESNYATPATLGDDRLALVAAAVKKYPKQNCLIIDAGSCLTFDLLTAKGVYLGGAISPGIQMRFKALHTFTGKLPLCAPEEQNNAVGTSTQEAIATGVMQGVIYEIEGQINQLSQKYTPLTVILTGGDALHLSKTVKNTIFAEPNFLAEGLDYILEYNKY